MKVLATLASIVALCFAARGAQAGGGPHELTAPALRLEFSDSACELAKQQFW